MQKLVRTKEVKSEKFYEYYLSSLPMALHITKSHRELLAVLFEYRNNNIIIKGKERRAISRALGITYSYLAVLVNSLKKEGVITSIKKGYVESALYIPKASTEITTQLVIADENSKV